MGGCLLQGSWRGLGARSRKKVLLNGSWPVQEEFQDGFHPKCGPKWDPKSLHGASFFRVQIGRVPRSFPRAFWRFPKSILKFSKSNFQVVQELFCLPKWRSNKGLTFQLPVWNSVPPSRARPKKGGTAGARPHGLSDKIIIMQPPPTTYCLLPTTFYVLHLPATTRYLGCRRS